MSADEDPISLSDAESEGEGPQIRPPQADLVKPKHKHKKKDRDWSKHDRREDDRHRDRKKIDRDRGRERRKDRDRDRHRDRDRDRRPPIEDMHNQGDLRHRLSRERYERHREPERRERYERDRRDETLEERERRRTEQEIRMNKFIRANKHMEETRQEVEKRKRSREIEKEMERLQAALKRKAEDKSRSRSRDKKKKKKKKKSETPEVDSDDEMDQDDEDVDSTEEEKDSDDGEEGSEEETEDSSDSEADSDDTGSKKSEETPDRNESSEDGEVQSDENEETEAIVKETNDVDLNKVEKEKKISSKPPSPSRPLESKWADKSPEDQTPSRSPTPLKSRSGGNDSDRTPRRRGHGERDSPADSRSQSPGNDPLDSPPVSPIPLKDELPAYLPSVHGCRSVAEFKCLNRIEEGTYGVVYRARDKRSQEIVALKRLKMEREKEGFPITSLREINTLLISQHPNVVTVREIVVGSNMDQIYIVMDFVHHDLKSLMETMRKKEQVFRVCEVKCLMVQLLRAILHLHDNWVLHRDLKASNLLLSNNGVLKVGDFGLAREYGSPLKAYTSIVVTLWYRAPELLLGIKEYSTHIDVWSIGCIFGELLLMEPVFPGKSEIDELNRIYKLLGTPSEKNWPGYKELPMVQKLKFVDNPVCHLRSKFTDKMLSDSGMSLLKGLLTYDPKKRLSCDAALRGEYFREEPLPTQPSMFPTWPAKSEQDPGDKVKKVSSPKPPSGGGAFKNMNDDDEERARGYVLPDAAIQESAQSWKIRF